MQNHNQTQIRCSACGQPFPATVYAYVDAGEEPQLKQQLLTGRLHAIQCPHCGTMNNIAAPMLYHDPTKELLIAHVPMELNLNKDQQERAIGDLMKHLPKDNFKGYMFSPRRALTMQGLVEQVLEADGVTPEMMEAQRERVRLIQTFLQATEASEEQLDQLIAEHDASIDGDFFRTMSVMGQRMLQENQPQIAQAVMALQQYILEKSTYGQEMLQQQEQQQEAIEAVAHAIQELGENATRAEFYTLAVEYRDDDEKLQALVGLARPAFDYEFFQQMTNNIEQAPAAERDDLNDLRERLVELTSAIDQQAQVAMQQASGFLQALVNHDDPGALIRANMPMINDTFMMVLTTNIKRAEEADDNATLTRLRMIYNTVVTILQDSMDPELRFINDLLSAATDDDARSLLADRANDLDDSFLEVLAAVEQAMEQQGNAQLVERTRALQAEAQRILT
jgi:hypothetical protein